MSSSCSGGNDLEAYRNYLRFLARTQLDERVRGRVDPSDVVQETMLEAHRSQQNFTGSSDAELTAWLHTILSRRIAHALRDHTRQRRDVRREQQIRNSVEQSSVRLEQLIDADVDSPSMGAVADEHSRRLADAIELLTTDQREAIVQHYFQGRPVREIAASMNRGEAAIGGLIHRGMQALRMHMRDE